MKKTNVLILTAGSVSSDLSGLFGKIPSGMIPIAGKPAISWIIDNFFVQGFRNFFISVGFEADLVKNFIRKKYNREKFVDFIDVDFKLGPGNSIISTLDKISGDDLLVCLGDTIIRDELVLDSDFVITSSDFDDSSKWCLAKYDDDRTIQYLLDKPMEVDNLDKTEALVGVYYFKDLNLLKKIVKNFDNTKRVEISDILNEYKKNRQILCINSLTWLDLGHLDKYQQAKMLLIKPRYFNGLEFDHLLSTVTKKSDYEEKFINEIRWYLELPKELSILTPRVLDYSLENKPYIKLEYYGYPLLSELFLYGSIHSRVWQKIIIKLKEVLLLFNKHIGEVSYQSCRLMYLDKTLDRINNLINADEFFQQIFSYKQVCINDNTYHNFYELTDFITEKVEELYKNISNHSCFIHGDFHFSNIVYDVNSGVVRLIDPRGKWGDSIYGDIRYDVAKLRHSVSGKYDFIVNDLFKVARQDNNFYLEFFNYDFHDEVGVILDKLISKSWDLQEIKFIEGLLFISMIPLHKDNRDRQLAMYCNGIKLLNEVFISQ